MEVLQKAITLFENFNNNDLLYCHWKSNEHLKEGLAGLTDLDVLVSDLQKELCVQCLTESGYIKLDAQFGSRYSEVEDWVACDEVTGKIIHIHLHYKMITGHKGMKEYVFPWNIEALNTRVLDDNFPVYIIEPTLEIIVLLSRIGLKTTYKNLFFARRNRFKLSPDDEREILFLRPKINNNHLDELLSHFFPSSYNDFKKIIFTDKRDGKWFLSLYKFCTHNHKKNCTERRLLKPIKRVYYYCIIRLRSFLRRKLHMPIVLNKRVAKKDGIIIAFLGQDGAGKTTVSREVRKWLSWKIETQSFYLGSGDNYHSIWKKLSIKLNTIHFYVLSKITSILDLYYLSIHVKKTTRKANKYSQKGGISIFDRYPQINYPGINDGPKIRCAINNGKVPNALKLLLLHFATKEESNYKKAIKYQPDLVFKLILPPEISIARKPEESYDAVLAKHEIIKKMEFNDSEVIIIDATMNYEKEIIFIHNQIWKKICSD